nr:hypothetical protein [Candidatus Sigynarchaeota archaeon]
MLDIGEFSSAHDILLFVIKPRLTGLQTDENGLPWGDGIFDNPWIVDNSTRMALLDDPVFSAPSGG